MSAPGYSKVPTLSGGQSNFLNQLLEMLGGTGAEGFEQSLQSLLGLISGSPESFEKFEAPLLRQFEEQTIPQLTERLTAYGGGGGRSSAGPQILGQAGAQLGESLGAQRGQLQQSAIQQLLGTFIQGGQLGLGTSPFAYMQKPPSFGTSIAGGLGQGIGGGIGLGLGGGLGNLLGGLFK